MYQAPRGEARREAILRATLALIGERGPDAVTHRAVAQLAGVPLAATTYWFSSKEELLREALVLAGREEVERLERLVLELAPRDLEPEEWADALAAELAADVDGRPAQHLAFYELVLDAARHPGLREEVARREQAFLRLAEVGLRAGGSPDPEGDAWIVVGAVSGLLLGQLANPQQDFSEQVLRPTLRRLFARLKETVPA
jgi:DNA-binding transcriptional regulator YbjK